VVHFHLESDFEFRPNSINARNQYRVHVLFIDREQPAESADLAQHSLGKSFVREILDALLRSIAAINADTSVGVGDRFALEVGILSHFSFRVLQGWRNFARAAKLEEAFQAQQILARLWLHPAGRTQRPSRHIAQQRKPQFQGTFVQAL
jgi:hypothetical protein